MAVLAHPSLQRRMGPFVCCQFALAEKGWGSDLVSASPSCRAPAPARPSPCADSIGSLLFVAGEGFATGLERLWGQCDTGEHRGTDRESGALPGLTLLGGAGIGPTWRSYRLNM